MIASTHAPIRIRPFRILSELDTGCTLNLRGYARMSEDQEEIVLILQITLQQSEKKNDISEQSIQCKMNYN